MNQIMKDNPKLTNQKLSPEEQELEETLGVAFETGTIKTPSKKELKTSKAKWKLAMENTLRRRAITLRLQERDISRLKVQAQELGMPYQTYLSSVLHQVASGKISASSR